MLFVTGVYLRDKTQFFFNFALESELSERLLFFLFMHWFGLAEVYQLHHGVWDKNA